jgi:undecaprenyl-diphosphatase
MAVRQVVRRILDLLHRLDLVVLLAMLTIVVGLWVFLTIADQVREGGTQAFDDRILRSLRRPDDPRIPAGPQWLHEVGRDLSAFGSICGLTLITLAVVGYLLLSRLNHAAIFLTVAVVSGWGLNTLLKSAFDRPRPSVVPHLDMVHSSSFPSGHSMLSAIVFLTLGSLLARLTPSYRLKVYFLSVAILLSGLVGLSRVYLGVHYPTDVLAGWSAGLVWAILCWLVARNLQHRGAVEGSPGEGTP